MDAAFASGPHRARMMRDEQGRPKSMFKNLRKLHGQGLETQGLNNLSDAFQTFVTRARFFSIGHLRRTWSHSAVEFMKYRRRLPALMANESEGEESEGEGTSADDCGLSMMRSSIGEECRSECFEVTKNHFSRFTSKSFRDSSTKEGSPSDSERRRIHVTNVSYRVTTSQLASFFSKFGKVSSCSIPVDKAGTLPRHGNRPKSKGAAFITFKSEEGVAAAKSARPDELKFYDRVMVVSQALPTPRKKDHPPLAPINAEEDPDAVSASDSESAPTSPAFAASLHALDDTVLGRILGLLDLQDRIRIERVCKKWLETAYRSWAEERVIRFSDRQYQLTGTDKSRKPLQRPVLEAVLRRAGPNLASLDLSSIPHFLDSTALRVVAAHCPHLQAIDFTGLKDFNWWLRFYMKDDREVDCEVDWQSLKLFAESCPDLKAVTCRDADGLGEKAFWYLFRNCKNLERVDLSGCKRLQGRCFRLLGIFLDKVWLNGCVGLETEAVEEMSLKSPHLSELHLDDCGRLNDQCIAVIARNMSSLKVLSLCGNVGEVSSGGLSQLGLMESLEEVYLDGNAAASDEVVESLTSGCLSLRRLSLSGAGDSDAISEVGLSSLASATELEELNLSKLAGVRDSVLVLALPSLSHLRVLRLRGCRNLSDKGIQGLVRGCDKLVELDLSGCLKIGDTGVTTLINRFPTKPGGDDDPVSVVVGGSGCLGQGLPTKGSRVVLDTSDYTQDYHPLFSGKAPGDGDASDEDIEDDEFESLTAGRSFVLERLEEDDLVIDEGRLAEWEAQFRALHPQ